MTVQELIKTIKYAEPVTGHVLKATWRTTSTSMIQRSIIVIRFGYRVPLDQHLHAILENNMINGFYFPIILCSRRYVTVDIYEYNIEITV